MRHVENESVLILDFGGQYAQLIARRVRDCHVFCEIKPYKTPISEIKQAGYKGIILTGGPNSVYDPVSPQCDPELLAIGIPVLGICYGAQVIAHCLDGEVGSAPVKEYGNTSVSMDLTSPLFAGIPHSDSITWMSHTDQIKQVPSGFHVTAHTEHCPIAAMENPEKQCYAVQFHPEVEHSVYGSQMLKNYLYQICQCKGDWKMASFIEATVQELKDTIGDKKVLCALSGGVDSSVAALLVHKAIGRNLTCIFVDHGLLRKNEGDDVERVFRQQFDMNLIRINAQQRFLSKLKGVQDPERKRKIIGEEFIRVFEEESKKIGHVDFLCQGTIYPDIVESGVGDSAVIKSHHNVGGLPEDVDFTGIVEPLRDLFKDEVRQVGTELGIPDALVWRQPFPGPGLGIRVIGDITEEKLDILREADAIFRQEIMDAGLNHSVNQYFAVLTGIHSVGVMGDDRTYDHTIALRAVTTTDFMTADWAKIPYDLLDKVSRRIVNEVKKVNRVLYDITSKPPATIEFE